MVEKLKQIVAFIRLGNLALISLYFFVFDSFLLTPIRLQLSQEPALSRNDLNLLILDVILVTIVGYWMNDWKDRAADKENRPDRFLVRNEINLTGFLILIGVPICIGGAVTLNLGMKTGNEAWMILYPIVLILLTIYAQKGKQLGFVGNVLVSLLIACLPLLLIIAEWSLFLNLETQKPEHFNAVLLLLIVYGMLMFFSNLARELVKDWQDVEGDKSVGSTSIPIRFGEQFTKGLISASMGIALFAQIYFIMQLTASTGLFFFAIAIAALMVATILFLIRRQIKMSLRMLSQGLKLTMLLGIVQLALYMLWEYSRIN